MSNKGKYSKSNLIAKRWITIFIILIILCIIGFISFNIYITNINNVVYENISKESKTVSENIASNSSPIIVNNIVVGAVYKSTWVDMQKYYESSVNKEEYDVDIFTTRGKTGSFKLNEVEKGEEYSIAYVTTTSANNKDEYFAVKTGDANVSKMYNIPLDDETVVKYSNDVKKALGKYIVLNSTINIREVYEISLIPGEMSYIINATNESQKGSGVYSVLVYVDSLGKSQIIKYNYIKDVNNAENFAIYIPKFIVDLNSDNKCEIILQETKEFNTKYSIMEYNDSKFYEVLSVEIDN